MLRWNSTTHFLPSSPNLGGFCGAVEAPYLGGDTDFFSLAGIGALPLNPGFLCVCISEVTFFKPIIHRVFHLVLYILRIFKISTDQNKTNICSPFVTFSPWLREAKSALRPESAPPPDGISSASGGGGGGGGGGAAGPPLVVLTKIIFGHSLILIIK